MEQFILSAINGPDFSLVLQGLVIYLLAMWVMFCLWVFIDANRRYRSVFKAILMTVLVFLFNFPALIFYIIVRPEEQSYGGLETQAGVEVPIIRFTNGKGEIQMAFNVKISPNWDPKADMTVGVAWDSPRQDVEVRVPTKVDSVQTAKPEAKLPFSSKLQGIAENLNNKNKPKNSVPVKQDKQISKQQEPNNKVSEA